MAVDSKELRPGNVIWESYGGYAVITGIGFNNKGPFPGTVLARHINGTVSGCFEENDIFPVKLSPDVLFRCGFKKESRGKEDDFDGIETVYCKDGIDIFDNTGNGGTFTYATYTRYPGRGFKSGYEIKSLHWLQNLFYFLNGKELTFISTNQ